jgi:hypothetical protein
MQLMQKYFLIMRATCAMNSYKTEFVFDLGVDVGVLEKRKQNWRNLLDKHFIAILQFINTQLKRKHSL